MTEQTTVTLQIVTTSPSTTVPIPSKVTQPAYDPYEVWLASEGPELLDLTRGEAMARARLGCGTEWPIGTVDFVLASVYRPITGFCPEG